MTAPTAGEPAQGTTAGRWGLPDGRELFRLIVAGASLVLVMTLTLGIDLSPGLDVKVGDLAPTDIRAPRGPHVHERHPHRGGS